MENDLDELKLIAELEILYKQLSIIFNYPDISNEFLDYLSLFSFKDNVCAKKVTNEGCWYCKECARQENSIICEECYKRGKDIHKGHTLKFNIVSIGCCDCGDPDYWDPKGFCTEHKGIFSNEQEVEDFLQTCFSPTELDQIREVIKEICLKVGQYLVSFPIQQTSHLSGQFQNILNSLLNVFFTLSEKSTGLLLIICQALSESYSFKTTNPCLQYNEGISLIYYNNLEHICKCPLISIILCALDDNLKWKQLFYFFLKHFKLKLLIGISYFTFFNIINDNEANDLFNLPFYLASDKMNSLVVRSKDLLQNILNNLYINAKESILSHNYKHFKQILDNIQIFFKYCFNYPSKHYLSDNFFIYQKIIDILELFQHINLLSFNSFTLENKEGYSLELLNIEIKLLFFISSIFYKLDYQDIPFISEILLYFNSKLQKENKNLNDDNYFFHIPLIRAFSIFLTQFGMARSIANHTDFYSSIKDIFSLIPNWEKLCQIISKELFKVISFVLSTNCNYWLNNDMDNYYFLYFRYVFSYCDLTLLKIIFSLFPDLFKIKNILESISFNQSDKIIIDNFCDNNKKIIKLNQEGNKKELSMVKEVFYILLKILRTDIFFLKLYFLNYEENKNKEFFSKEITEVIELENKNLREILKQNLIHIILELSNSTSSKDIYKEIPTFFKELFIREKIDEIIIEITSQVYNKTQGTKLSLKKEYLAQYDFNVYSDPQICFKSQKYILEFKKNEINLLNTTNFPCLSLLKEWYKFIYKSFFDNEDNMKFLIRFTEMFLLDIEVQECASKFLFPIMKLISIFIQICKEETSLKDLKNKYKDNLVNLSKKIKDYLPIEESQKLLYLYLQNRILDLYSLNNNSLDYKIISKNKNKSKNTLLMKFKNQFNNKNIKILKQFNEKINSENSLNSEYCVICREVLSPEKYSNEPYGKFGLILNDNLIYLSALKSIRKEYNALSNEKRIPFAQYIIKFQKKDFNDLLHIRFSSCSHKIHFNCFINYSNDTGISPCPLCKNYNNIYIPDFATFPKEIKDSLIPKNLFNGLLEKGEYSSPSYIEYNVNFSVNSLINKIIKKKRINKDKVEKIAESLFKDFHWWLIFLENNSETIQSIELIQNLIFCIRISNLKIKFFLVNTLKELCQKIIKVEEKIDYYISDQISYTFSVILFILLVWVSPDELKRIRDQVMKLFLPSITFAAFMKHLYTSNKLEYDHSLNISNVSLGSLTNSYNYSISDISKTQNQFFLSFFRKYTLSEVIANYPNETSHNITIQKVSLKDYFILFELNQDNLDNMRDILFNESNNISPFSRETKEINFIDQINSMISLYHLSKETIPTIIDPFFLNIGTGTPFKFIDLPENLFDFISKYQNIPCSCHWEKSTKCLLCLVCGKLFCQNELIYDKDYKKYYIAQLHSIHCGGLCPYINTLNGQILFYLFSKEIQKNLYIYVDKFGEPPEKESISGEFKFNKEAYEETLKNFINLSFISYSSSISNEEITDEIDVSLADEI